MSIMFTDIDASVQERNSTKVLETITNPIFLKHGFICAFTVVSNPIAALEFTEHTCYDVILINQDVPLFGISAGEFVRYFRNMGACAPIILVFLFFSTDVIIVLQIDVCSVCMSVVVRAYTVYTYVRYIFIYCSMYATYLYNISMNISCLFPNVNNVCISIHRCQPTCRRR